MARKQAPPNAKPKPDLNPPVETASIDPVQALGSSFPIVGIGASAGGLAAFEAFFSGMPADTDPGMAFVLVQHLRRTYWGRHFWARGYFCCSSGNVTDEVIMNYIATQDITSDDNFKVEEDGD